MRAILGFALVLGLGAAAATAADVDEKKLIGKWEAEVKKGTKTVTEFQKGGKVTFATAGPKGGDFKVEGKYTVAGDKLTVTMNFGKEVKSEMTVKKLTDDELVTVDEKGKTTTMKKVK